MDLPVYYRGRLWDAPFTDGALPMPDELAESLLPAPCIWCDEPMAADDDILLLPAITAHLECHIRSFLGDIQHLEERCLCFRGAGNEEVRETDHYDTYRESAKASVQWLLDHNQGRFHP